MKKCISLFLVSILFITAVKAAGGFIDVGPGHAYKDAIYYAYENGIVKGYSDMTYRPDELITRGQFTKILIKATQNMDDINKCMGVHSDGIAAGTTNYKNIFSDVESGITTNGNIFKSEEDIYKQFTDDQVEGLYSTVGGDLSPVIRTGSNTFVKYICMAKAKNIISGYSDGTFRPDGYITVGEASKIIANAFDEIFNTKNSEASVGSYKFQIYVDALYDSSIYPSGLISLDQNLTRGQMSEMIYRVKLVSGEAETEKIQICPSAWYHNFMPCICSDEACLSCKSSDRKYMIVNGQNIVELKMDVNYVINTCGIDQPESIE